MYIQQFKIQGFRSLVDVELTDLRPIIVLFGHNGSGKSNILAALEAVFSPKLQAGYQPGAPSSPGPFYRGLITDFHNNYYRNTPCEIPFEVTIRTSKTELEEKWPEGFTEGVFSLPKGTPQDRVRIQLVGQFEPEPELPQAARIVLRSAKINTTRIYQIATSPDESWLPDVKDKLALGQREKIGDTLLNSLTGLFSNVGLARFLQREDFFPAGQEGEAGLEPGQAELSSNFKRRLFGLKHSQLQADQDKFRRIRELYDGTAGWGEIDFSQSGNNLDVMTWDGAKLWLPIARRGAGSEQLLVVLSEVVLRDASIIGIEELESNLDEDHQKKLYDLLEKLVSAPNSQVGQVIATAHSFFFGGELLPHEKRYVQRQESGQTLVEAWSQDAHQALFKPHAYYEERLKGQQQAAVARRRSRTRPARTNLSPS